MAATNIFLINHFVCPSVKYLDRNDSNFKVSKEGVWRFMIQIHRKFVQACSAVKGKIVLLHVLNTILFHGLIPGGHDVGLFEYSIG